MIEFMLPSKIFELPVAFFPRQNFEKRGEGGCSIVVELEVAVDRRYIELSAATKLDILPFVTSFQAR